MVEHQLEIFYRATHNACSFRVRLPSPRLIQELVQAWKVLRARQTQDGQKSWSIDPRQ
jgi:hypothetical protein